MASWISQALSSFSGRLKSVPPPPPPKPKYDLEGIEEQPLTYRPPTFLHDDPAASRYLDDFGYVVFREIASKEQQDEAISLFWDLLEAKSRMKRDDPETWGNENWLPDPVAGIMASNGIGQSAFLWYCRTLPHLKSAFSTIWGTDDLLVSYDGCGVFRPIEANPKWKTKGNWHHIDQNIRKKPGKQCVQGLLNLLPSGEFDGGFVAVPRSHQMMENSIAKNPDLMGARSHDYMRVHTNEEYWIKAEQEIVRDESNQYDLLPVKFILEPGEFIMWDSRTIHCSHPSTKPSSDPSAAKQLKRLAAYICMTPASFATNLEKLVKYRVYAFQRGVSTSHWPHEFHPSWSFKEKIAGVGIDTVKLTPEQATLITGKEFARDVYEDVGDLPNPDRYEP